MNTIKSEGNIQLIHATMPQSWTSLAQKIYYLFSEYGIESLKDCKADCNKTTYNIVKCYNMFCSAIAAYNVGKYKEADLIINYIKAQLKMLYPNMSFRNKTLYIGSGLDLLDVIKPEQKIEDINTLVGSYQIDVESDTYLYLAFSTGLSYNRITFNNYDIPFEEVTIQEINGDSYQILKSVNTYIKGSYIIKIE